MKQRNRVAILNIASTLILNCIAIFTAPLFQRLLDKPGYGVVSIYSIWTSVIAIIFTLQTQGTLVNARVEYDEEEQEKYQSSVMGLSLVVFLAFAALVVIFIRPIAGALKLEWFLILLMLVHAFGTFCVNFLSTKFIYEFKPGWKMILSVSVPLATLGVSLLFVLNMPYESRYIGRILGISSVYGLLGIPICIYVLSRGKTFFHRQYWKFCLALAIPTVCYNLSDIILGQCDRVMLQQMMSTSMVAEYSYALGFAGIMFAIFGALNHTWCPYFFDDMKLGRGEALEARTKNFLELFTVLSVGFLLLATEVFHVYSKRDYWSGTRLIPIFVTSYYINFLCTFPVNYEYFRKKTKVVAVVTVIATVTNLALNYVLILKWQMLGAALATAISHCLQLIIHHCYCRFALGRTDYPFPIRLWRPYLLCYFAVVVLVYLLPGAWYIRWPLGAAIGLWELWRIKKRKVLI